MANIKISATTVLAAIVGTEKIPAIDVSNGEWHITPNMQREYTNKIRHPGFIAGNWYDMWPSVAVGAGSALTANTAYCTPFQVFQSFSVTALGARVTTAGTNLQLALYASNNATGRPTGSVLASTASITATGTGAVNGAISTTVLSPGIYWFCASGDNSAMCLQGAAGNWPWMAKLFGSATQGNALGASISCMGVSTTDFGFGAWNSATSATYTELTSARVAIPNLKG